MWRSAIPPNFPVTRWQVLVRHLTTESQNPISLSWARFVPLVSAKNVFYSRKFLESVLLKSWIRLPLHWIVKSDHLVTHREFTVQYRSRYSFIFKNPCVMFQLFGEGIERKPQWENTLRTKSLQNRSRQGKEAGLQEAGLPLQARPDHALITPASRLIYSVFYSILHLHKMLVFSRWGYNHNKLFANAPGLHHRVKTNKNKLCWELKWKKK